MLKQRTAVNLFQGLRDVFHPFMLCIFADVSANLDAKITISNAVLSEVRNKSNVNLEI